MISSPIEISSIALFLVFVALAVYAQNLTGFALALILLGLVGATDLYPLPDVVNVVSIIALVNAMIFLYKRRALRLERALWPALLASFVGTVLGVMALSWIVGNAYELLRLLLGASIIYCAWILWRRKTQLKTASPPSAFISVGLLSGLMSGLFSAGGPPLVYQVYQQPWPLARMQESLMYLFGAGALLRLIIVVPSGGFTSQALILSVVTLPAVILITLLTAQRKPPFSPRALKFLVCLLLISTGIMMVHGATSVLISA